MDNFLIFFSYFWYAFNVFVIPPKLLLLTISVYTNTHFKLRLKETRRGMIGEKKKIKIKTQNNLNATGKANKSVYKPPNKPHSSVSFQLGPECNRNMWIALEPTVRSHPRLPLYGYKHGICFSPCKNTSSDSPSKYLSSNPFRRISGISHINHFRH